MKYSNSLRTHRYAARFIGAIVLAAALPVVQYAAKRPLNHRDYDSWRAIQSQTLSRDGKFLAYALFPQEGDGQIVVRNLATGKELRENAGTPPPPRESGDSEGPPVDLTPGAGLRIVVTYDNRFVIASSFPAKADTEKAVKERKRPDEMPKNSVIVIDLSSMSASRIQDVASFQIPESGDSFLAYLKTAPPAAPAAAGGNGDGRDRAGDQGGPRRPWRRCSRRPQPWPVRRRADASRPAGYRQGSFVQRCGGVFLE